MTAFSVDGRHQMNMAAARRKASKTRARNRKAHTARVFGAGVLTGIALFSAIHVATHASPGRIYEDDPRWDCVSMGNRVCGPDNNRGVPAGVYDKGGVLIMDWNTYTAIAHAHAHA